MDITEKLEELLATNKEGLINAKDEIIKEINEHIHFHFVEDDLHSLFEIRTFITQKQSYFALTFTLLPPILSLKGVDISLLSVDTIKQAYQDAIKINEELHSESEKIYSELLPKKSSI
ncbi:hypothetical protein [Chryseobacterium sp. MA9]|uniref:hypothetical protein n=1 Tax=Chryseobacterium sp. MA9 TaxID=2966625 RepID=UPI0021031B0A|nr:hypothetical protein [Chryseobacterium sp. MA9]UTX49854.1 hypothetical protein KIK00_06220 [Chryseobacterium sp. MA9]